MIAGQEAKRAGVAPGAQPLPVAGRPRRFLRFLGGYRGLTGAGQ
jgi:hypothetical protein